MTRQIKVALSLLACFWMTACESESSVPGSNVGKVYVVVSAEKGPLFTRYLASVVKKHGMTPNLGQATDDKGYSVYVLDAMNSSVRLRSQNVLLSGQEDSEQCGIYNEPHSDPGQFFIVVSPATQATDSHDARDFLAALIKDLEADGYDVQQQPVTCSKQSKDASKK